MIEVFLIILLISVIAALILVARLWNLRNMPGAASLLFANLALGLWSFSYVMEIVTPGLAEKLLWAKVQYLGIAFLPVWFLFFILTYSGRAAQIQRWQIISLIIIPTLSVTIAFTNEMHHWLWTTIDLQTGWRYAPLSLGHGGWFWIHSAYCYLLLLWSTILLVQFARGSQKLYTSQSTLMLIGLLAPWASNIFYLMGFIVEPGLDFTPLAFSITTLLMVLAFIRFRLFDILPVAYPTIFQAISDAVIVLDGKDRIVDANPAAQGILTALGGKKLGDLLDLSPSTNEDQQELTIPQAAGSQTYILRSVPLPQAILRSSGRLIILTDITERIHAAEKLQLAHEAALEANRLKTQLLANVSHDLRTPLGAIIGYAEMLQEGVYGSVTSEQHGAAAEIIDSSNQLLMFVNNLIGQAQIETGRVRMVFKLFPVKDVIDSLQSVVGLVSQKKGLSVAYEIDPLLPTWVCGDPYWLRQMVLNLLTNAVKFTEDGSIHVRLFKVDPAWWAIEVADTGIGISEDAQRTIFEPYYQVDNTAARHTGSGLGLFIIKELADQMGGRVTVQSRLGVGSTFRVTLPLQMRENA